MPEKFASLNAAEKAICQRFKEAREDAGVTQERVARHIGLSRDQVASIEAGRVALRFWPGWKFCAELDVNAAWLFDGEGPFRPCGDYIKNWHAPDEIERDPNSLFSSGFATIEDIYRREYLKHGYQKRSGESLRKEIGRPVHGTPVAHKTAISVLVDGWLSGLAPEARDAFVAHLCAAADGFKADLPTRSKRKPAYQMTEDDLREHVAGLQRRLDEWEQKQIQFAAVAKRSRRAKAAKQTDQKSQRRTAKVAVQK